MQTAASNDALQYELLAVTFFWAEGGRDGTSLVKAQKAISASIRRDVGCYGLSSEQGGAMLLRSISRRPVYPNFMGNWECWLVPFVLESDKRVAKVDVAARIGEAAAAMKKTTLVTVQLGRRVVVCESTFLLASIPV